MSKESGPVVVAVVFYLDSTLGLVIRFGQDWLHSVVAGVEIHDRRLEQTAFGHLRIA